MATRARASAGNGGGRSAPITFLGCLRGVPYTYAVESDEPIVLQDSRLGMSSAGAYTLFTTIAYLG